MTVSNTANLFVEVKGLHGRPLHPRAVDVPDILEGVILHDAAAPAPERRAALPAYLTKAEGGSAANGSGDAPLVRRAYVEAPHVGALVAAGVDRVSFEAQVGAATRQALPGPKTAVSGR